MKCFMLAVGLFLVGNVINAQEAPKPATVQQIKTAIDWAKVPRLEGASKVHTYLHYITYEAPGTFPPAADFYLEQLPKLGWQNDKTLASGDQKEYLGLVFEKAGMRLNVYGYRGEPKGPLTITLMLAGNVDVNLFPKVADAQVKVDNKNSVYYFSKQSPEEIASFCRKFMKERGWSEKVNVKAATWAKEGRHVLTFRQNAMECVIVAAKTKEGGMEVTYSAMVQHELSREDVISAIDSKEQAKPATLEEAIKVIDISKLPRMARATKAKHEKGIQSIPFGTAYEVPDSLDDAVKFYRKLLKEQSCTELAPYAEMDILSVLNFEKSGFLLVLTVTREKKEGNTAVALINRGNIDLRKLPYPPGAKFPSNRGEYVSTETMLSVDEAFAFYRKELPKLGWKEVKQRGDATMQFTQNAIVLDLEIQLDVYKKTVIHLEARMR